MTTGETPLEGVSKVEERTRELSASAGDQAAWSAAQLLVEYVSDEGTPLSREGYGAILAAEREKAAAKFIEEREAGLYNNETSEAPGLTAILRLRPDNEGRDRRALDLVPVQPEFNSPSIEDMGEIDENTRLFALTLPEGVYHADNFMSFYAKGEVWGGKIRGEGDDSFSLFPFQVVRIEGYSGELWQNPEYHPDGTKKTPQEFLD